MQRALKSTVTASGIVSVSKENGGTYPCSVVTVNSPINAPPPIKAPPSFS